MARSVQGGGNKMEQRITTSEFFMSIWINSSEADGFVVVSHLGEQLDRSHSINRTSFLTLNSLKRTVHNNKPRKPDHLKNNILVTCRDMAQDTLSWWEAYLERVCILFRLVSIRHTLQPNDWRLVAGEFVMHGLRSQNGYYWKIVGANPSGCRIS
ncbi:hypothetical protein CRM22_009594 [Opisthorchis felineus]|uniref:Uncharacterized protein n=1 Tax=Opisthorchis felineus TaxID=147828 RepID=A0A4S2LDB3_OPIFE|nr:hypothetical protein CRM22_009594 [Opisthorchis felineus]